jgi:alpha-mannosidase
LPAAADGSAAAGQFAVVERGLTEEAGHGEVPTPTFPAHGWVHVAGATVLLDHVTEYELVDGRELALTALRSTGLISRNDNPFREDPAGPEVAVPGAQMIGPWRFGFAIVPHPGTWQADGIAAAAEAYHHPFVTASGSGPTLGRDDPGGGPSTATRAAALRIGGAGVVLSALRRRGDDLEIRLVAETDAPTTATISARPILAAHDVDLLGRIGSALPIEPDGSLRVDLGPWAIRTIRLVDRPG